VESRHPRFRCGERGRSFLTSRPPASSMPAPYEAHLPAQQPAPQAHPWISRADADASGPRRHIGASAQRAQKTDGVNSGPAAAETFSRDDRLRKRREFEECYASGVRASGRFIQVFLSAGESAPLGDGRCRLGISVPRRVGNAVARNRVRRRLREIFRREKASLPASARALVIHARPTAAPASFAEVRADYLDTVARAGRASASGSGRRLR